MTLDELKETEWFQSRPPVIQQAICQWPPMTVIMVDNAPHYVIGYTETDASEKSLDPADLMIIVSPLDPDKDLEAARAVEFRICAHHVASVPVH